MCEKTVQDEFGGWNLDLGIPKPTTSKRAIPLESFPRVLSSILLVEKLFESIPDYRFFQGRRFLFRGHSDRNYVLISTLGRNQNAEKNHDLNKYCTLKEICEDYGYSSYRHPSFNEELFYLSIGRHLGFNCRLLDWTAGFWDAISFMLFDNIDKDGALWVMSIPSEKADENMNPFCIDDCSLHILREDYFFPGDNSYLPLGIQRREHQHGFFSVVNENLLFTPHNEIGRKSGILFYEFIVPIEVKDALRSSPRIISVKEWFYINQTAPILEQIQSLNIGYENY